MALENSPNPLEWREVNPSQWERDLDEVELAMAFFEKMYEATDYLPIAVATHVTIAVKIPETENHNTIDDQLTEALRKAWLTIRYEHPSIASRITYDTTDLRLKRVYTCLEDHGELYLSGDWMSQTFRESKTNMPVDAWYNANSPAFKIPTLFSLRRSSSSEYVAQGVVHRELILRCPHNTIDGVGALMIVDAILQLTVKALKQGSKFQLPKFGDEAQRLTPPLRIAADITSNMSPEVQKRLDELSSFRKTFLEGIEMITLPTKFDAQIPGRPQRAAITLNHEKTKQLLSKCNQIGVTVTHAYHAAIALVLSTFVKGHSEARSVKYLSRGPIDIRKRCRPPFNTRSHAVAAYFTISPGPLMVNFDIPAASRVATIQETIASKNEQARVDVLNPGQLEEYPRLLQEMKSYYVGMRDDPDLQQLSTLLFGNDYASRALWEGPQPPPIPPPNPLPTVTISSLGVIEKSVTPQWTFSSDATSSDIVMDVYNAWVIGEETATGYGCFLSTFRGELNFSAAYNQAWHDQEEVEDFLNLVQTVVWKGLKVED